jgi:hypothetical protein
MKKVDCDYKDCGLRRINWGEPDTQRGTQSFEVPDEAKGPFYCSISCACMDGFMCVNTNNIPGNKFYYGIDTLQPVTLKMLQKHVGPGWSKIIEDLVIELIENGWNRQVQQIKEKFGSLRFYIELEENDKLIPIIWRYESKSYNTCEQCGDYGEIKRIGHLLKCFCDHCMDFAKVNGLQ